ncbi:sigma-54-dependent transcriptional regulator [Steroidobacter flavus]|uniref:Sigma-54-dependent transcriptional regulator n=1 Tax=Steroidobacter flavus TaxID=1842136 RepID=A0ABV8SVJ4_9GAMM
MTVAPSNKPTVLVLDDEKNIRRSIEIALEPEGYEVLAAHDAAAAMRILQERIVDLMLIDIRLGDIDGLTFYKKVQTDGIHTPVIFISGNATLTEAAQAVKLGGFDFLEKPFTAEKLAVSVRRCLEYTALQRRLRAVEARSPAPQIVGDSPAIRKLVTDALRVAETSANVLITGESGTGKELVANSIHTHSARCAAPFVKVNCSAIPESLIESELFGHERGAFTGASGTRRGLFEVAHSGTIFLDEIADLALPAQAKILRVLQSGEIQKVGAERSIKVDVRVLSGTHKDLKKAVALGAFREDLYYRLNVVPLRVPSLRERVEDIPLLVRFIAQRLCEKNNLKEKEIDEDVLWELKRYPWPGNVRELQNVLERMLIMSGERVTVVNLPEELLATEVTATNSGSALREFRDRTERAYIIGVLRKHKGNVSQAAVELGIGRPYLHKRMAVLEIGKKDIYS